MATRRSDPHPSPGGITTIANYLLDRLVQAGVRHIFGVPGDYSLLFLDAIDAHPDLEWVGTANELNAAYAADGYARMNGLAALVTTYGVGELSAINGVAGSCAEHVPVLHIVGMPATDVQRQGLHVHHGLLDGDPGHFVRAFEEVTCASATLAVDTTLTAEVADTADSAAAEIDRVLRRVLAEKKPGYLGLPTDLVHARCLTAEEEWVADLATGDLLGSEGEPALSGFVERAAELVDGATRVVVLVDHLADRHHVRAELDALIRAGHLPSATTKAARGTVDETTPGFLGVYVGAAGEDGVRAAVEGADVVIAVGLHLSDLSSGGFTATLDPRRLLDLRPTHAVVGGVPCRGVTMAAALSALTAVVAGRGPVADDAPAWSSRPARGAPASVPADTELTQATLWDRFADFLRPDDLIAADQGTAFEGLLGVRLPRGADLIAQPLWASIGHTLPALLGAQLGASRRRRAVLLIGDGALQMTAQELGGIIAQGLDPIIVVLNNDGYTVERVIHGGDARYNGIARWNWSAWPSLFGASPDAVVRRVTTVGELDDALAACAEPAGNVSLVEVVLGHYDVPPALSRLVRTVAAAGE
ncbi:alpha-keto acid decarboxylase family protein [Actinopolymorpha pittospori]